MADPRPLGPSKYRLVTDAPRDPVTGRRVQKTAVFTGSLTEARHAQAAWETKWRGVDHVGTSATFNLLADRFLDHLRPHVANQTYNNHERHLRLHLRPTLGNLELRNITVSHLDDLWHQLATTPQPNGTLREASSIGKIHNTALIVFNQAVRWDWITRNPVTLSRKPTAHRKPPVAPDVEQVAGFIEWLRVHEPTVVVFEELLAVVGCRPGELCAVRWQDVDLPNAVLHVTGSIERGRMRTRKATKTHKNRSVALDAGTVRMLEKHRAEQGTINPDGFVFAEPGDPTASTPWAPGTMSTRMVRWQEQSGFKVTMRGLRHFVATQLLAAGVDPRTVADRLGHANPSMTLDIYAAHLPQKGREAAEIMARLRSEG